MSIPWTDKVTNAAVLHRVGTPAPLLPRIHRLQLSYFGHVVRAGEGHDNGKDRWKTEKGTTENEVDRQGYRVSWDEAWGYGADVPQERPVEEDYLSGHHELHAIGWHLIIINNYNNK